MAVAQALPSRAEEDASRIGNGWKRDQRRNPVKQVAGCRLRAGPDRHRQQHDIAGREARRRRAPGPVPPWCRPLGLSAHIVEVRFVSDAASTVSMKGAGVPSARQRIVTRLAREIDPRLFDARQDTERLLDLLDAAATMNGRDGEVSLAQAFADVAARQKQFVIDRATVNRRIGKLDGGRATAHRTLYCPVMAALLDAVSLSRDMHARCRDPGWETRQSSLQVLLPG